jgi:hypothetical protein
LNCIAIFVHASDGTAFCAHISPCTMDAALYEAICIRGDGILFSSMMKRLREVFKYKKPSELFISLVGGWGYADRYPLLEQFFAGDESMWTFSSVIYKFVTDTFPGSDVDVSHLNKFNGVCWADRTLFRKLSLVAVGEAFRIVAMETRTGKINLQTTDTCDLTNTQGYGVNIPRQVLCEGDKHLNKMNQRYDEFDFDWNTGDPMPTPVLQEYTGVL